MPMILQHDGTVALLRQSEINNKSSMVLNELPDMAVYAFPSNDGFMINLPQGVELEDAVPFVNTSFIDENDKVRFEVIKN
jgi:hypothetical protein